MANIYIPDVLKRWRKILFQSRKNNDHMMIRYNHRFHSSVAMQPPCTSLKYPIISASIINRVHYSKHIVQEFAMIIFSLSIDRSLSDRGRFEITVKYDARFDATPFALEVLSNDDGWKQKEKNEELHSIDSESLSIFAILSSRPLHRIYLHRWNLLLFFFFIYYFFVVVYLKLEHLETSKTAIDMLLRFCWHCPDRSLSMYRQWHLQDKQARLVF